MVNFLKPFSNSNSADAPRMDSRSFSSLGFPRPWLFGSLSIIPSLSLDELKLCTYRSYEQCVCIVIRRLGSIQEVSGMSDQKKEVALFAGTLSVSLTDRGEGRGFLVLHGGAGPASASGLAEALSKSGRVVAPIHPGFAGEPRPDWFSSIDDLVI